MKKKGIWFLLAAVFVYVIFDYVSGLRKEEAVLEQAQQGSELVVQDDLTSESIDLPENTEDLSEEELEEIFEQYFEDNQEGQSDVQFG